jgi:hypothetical protein
MVVRIHEARHIDVATVGDQVPTTYLDVVAVVIVHEVFHFAKLTINDGEAERVILGNELVIRCTEEMSGNTQSAPGMIHANLER